MLRKDIHNLILDLLHTGKKLSAEEIMESMPSSTDTKTVWEEILSMEESYEIMRTKRQTYVLPENAGYVVGRLQLTSKGFGFVIPDNKGDKPDIFIGQRLLNSGMNDDRVLVHVTSAPSDKKPEGEIVRIISRANSKIVGVFHQSKDYAFVTPKDNHIGKDIYVMRKNFNGAKDNQVVVVEITVWPEGECKAEGKVTEILGRVGDVGLEILSIIKQHDLPLEFPKEVLDAAKSIPEKVQTSELDGRRDLRDLPIVTVDGEDAKDLDDAVYVKKINNNDYLLGVYIADVSHYVEEGSIIDKEAYVRGTSVYLVDRVLPMLPERLCNGICSLNAGVDRLAMSCEMHINTNGTITSYEIFPSVIHVRHRLSYNIVRNVLAGDEELSNKYEDVVPMISVMDELRQILHAKRHKRGAVDFSLPEQKVILDEKLHPVRIEQRIQGDAENLIEEFMLAANETVAHHLYKKHRPSVYRVHGQPKAEKMQDLAKLLANFNVKFAPQEEVKPKEIQKAIEAMHGRVEERLVTAVALRSMQQAVYQTENIGHFGLAATYYTHFTSPIRRYPDLLVHRQLCNWMENPRMKKEDVEPLTDRLEVAAEHSSLRERAAAEAERQTVELKKCEYMQEHIGEEFDGVISGVANFGLFVELANGVEGLVHITSLVDDYYDFYVDRYALVGSHTGKTYRLGDSLRVEVLNVNMEEVSIDFILAGENAGVREHIKQNLLSKSSLPAKSAPTKKASKVRTKAHIAVGFEPDGFSRKPKSKKGKGKGKGERKFAAMNKPKSNKNRKRR
ncbi:MAG: ribonuclease R [Phascolarctobacterium sp.]|nr:ribonuclease R [Phascolarctobacterium sp.]